ncbi:MAG: hypothetical protein D6741_12680, partial [Planctomycetota bacterium]
MPGDPLKKVRPGQRLQIPAEAFNTFIDAALDYRKRRHQQARKKHTQQPSSTIVRVRNQTGSDLDRFAVVALDGPILTPTDNLRAFQEQIAFDGTAPASDTQGRFAILWEPAPAGRIVRACIAGVSIVKLNVGDENHTHAEVVAGQTGYLQSSTSGPAVILWKEAGTGTKWAIVRFGGGAGDTTPSVLPELGRFRLDTPLPPCGIAYASRIHYTEGERDLTDLLDTGGIWCEQGAQVTLVDALGIVPGEGLAPGAYLWAARMPDGHLWELIQYGTGCCNGSSSSGSS